MSLFYCSQGHITDVRTKRLVSDKSMSALLIMLMSSGPSETSAHFITKTPSAPLS